jgi:hypothetical protein
MYIAPMITQQKKGPVIAQITVHVGVYHQYHHQRCQSLPACPMYKCNSPYTPAAVGCSRYVTDAPQQPPHLLAQLLTVVLLLVPPHCQVVWRMR